MLTASPVVRSASARTLFLSSTAVTIAIHLWAENIHKTVGDFLLSGDFLMLFTDYDRQAAVGLLLTLILAVFIARPAWLRPVASWVSDHTNAIAAGAAALLSAGTIVVYRNHPLSMDEYTQFFQGQAFAAGHLAGRFPVGLLDWLIPPEFQGHFLYASRTTGEVASGYWPSFALLLVPFIWLKMPWACNPVISALTLVVVHRLALELFDNREAAGLAVLLTAASPVFFGDGISYYSESAHLLANAVYALLLIRPTPRKALAAGLVGSIALTLHNPFPHLLFAVPWVVWVASRQQGVRLLAWLSAGYLPLSLVLGLGWALFVHGLPHGGFTLAIHPGDLFSAHDPLNPTFTPIPRLGVLYARLIGLAKIWVWAVPGLMILACVGAWKTRGDVRCRLLAASAATIFTGYLFVSFDQGHGWGFRYFHGAWFVLPLFAATALTRSPAAPNQHEGFANEQVRAFVTACALLTLVIGIGQQAMLMDDFISHQLERGPRYSGNDGRVVIVNASEAFYAIDLVQNDPLLRDRVIHMFSHGPEADAAMMRTQLPEMRRIYGDSWGSVWTDKPLGDLGAADH